jgi:uncharacterized protein YlxW (UPF0749 family)
MSLLVDLWTNSLDPGYAAAAAGRQAPPETAERSGARRGSAALALGIAAAVLIVVIAGVQAHGRAPAAAKSRAALSAEVQRQSKAVAALTKQVDELRAATARLRNEQLQGSAAGSALASQLSSEELAAGVVPVIGPGLRVRLDDAPANGQADRNRVMDRDLQAVVNALWASGAEAVAINGQRLTGQSSIREAGEAILVDFQPVHAPYVVSAVGDPVGMEASFAQSAAAARMRSYVQLYNLGFDYARAGSLQLPAAAEEPLHAASPVPTRRSHS